MISQQEILFFQDLFQKAPNSIFLHIDNNCSDIKKILEDFIGIIDGVLKYKDFQTLNLERFRLTARDFEYVVVSNCLKDLTNKDKFIQEIYHSLENSANIILIEEKKNNNLLEMIGILDRNDFRATNSIDIFENFNLAIAKKMHMWGNGL
jgi:hypothetical protein